MKNFFVASLCVMVMACSASAATTTRSSSIQIVTSKKISTSTTTKKVTASKPALKPALKPVAAKLLPSAGSIPVAGSGFTIVAPTTAPLATEVPLTIFANPQVVSSGSTSVLTWSSTGLSQCSLSDRATALAANGSVTSAPITSTTVFTITCSDRSRAQYTASTTVTIKQASSTPATGGAVRRLAMSISAFPKTVASGGTTTLTWSQSGYSVCYSSFIRGTVNATGTVVYGPLVRDAIYLLQCKNAAGVFVEASTTVQVKPFTVSVTASNPVLSSSTKSVVKFGSEGASSCVTNFTYGTSTNGGITFIYARTRSIPQPLQVTCVNGNVAKIATATVTIGTVVPPRLTAQNLGVVINSNDPDSESIALYYQNKRGIPAANIVRVQLPVKNEITTDEFKSAYDAVKVGMPAQVQALALAWTIPSRVACQSMTSAFASGVSASACTGYDVSLLYATSTHTPYTDFKIRPAMMLAGETKQKVIAMIDRGFSSDATYPSGKNYVMNTSDYTRSLRANVFDTEKLGYAINPYISSQIVSSNSLGNATDSLFYFTGLEFVPDLDKIMPPLGAVADHFTSAGGMLMDSYQMSALKFISAGFVGSYGTVVEPYAVASKFPDPALMVKYYAGGDTLIESYWKSVQFPTQGVFIGDPLARPWGDR